MNIYFTLKIKFGNHHLDFSGDWPKLDYYELVQKYANIDLSEFTEVEKLKEKRYPFVIKKHDGIKLLLVGPFDTKKGAKKYLKEIKRRTKSKP